jgi:hypothetical protein
MLSAVMQSVFFAECRYAECHYAECFNAECHYAECRGAHFDHFLYKSFHKNGPKLSHSSLTQIIFI